MIITLSEHAVWGPILQPILVKEELTGALTILEIIGNKSTFFTQLSDSEKEIVQMAEKVSDKVLMKNFSKDKNIAEFHRNVSIETIERYIRPIIDAFHRKTIETLKATKLSLYIRNSVKTRVLYDTEKVIIPNNLSQVVFNFHKDAESGFRYFISLKCENEEFDLHSKSYYALCNEPAVLVINHKLHKFSDIDIKKLVPFFTKKHILVPASAEKTYIEKFVKNCVEKYEVKAEGIEIHEINPNKKAFLYLANDWNMAPVLYLNFKYNNKEFAVDAPNKKNVFVEERDGKVFLTWYYPDKRWEKSLINMLLNAGLKKTGINHFSIINTIDDSTENEKMVSMVEWLREHTEILKHFEFTQQIPDKTFFIGEISVNTDIESKQDWFDIRVVAIFGEYKIPFARFRNHILNNIREYILPDDTIAILPMEWFTRYYEMFLFTQKENDSIRLKIHHFGIVSQIQQIKKIELSTFDDRNELTAIPEGICGELRNYQHKGFAWLVHLYENSFGGCLADDMGLGKTLQTITLLQHISIIQKNKKTEFQHKNKINESKELVQLTIFDAINEEETKSLPSLIVMPTSLIHNWKNEFKKFAPSLKVYIYSGVNRIKSNDIHKIFSFNDVVLTTYGTLRNDVDLIQKCQFHHLILDESQYIKNPASLAYNAVKQINALHKLVLTGTPVENSLTDLWAQLNIVNEGMLGNQTTFKNAYLNPIIKNNKAKEDALLRIIQPFILRRTKDEVAPELPPLSQETVYCDMSEEQQSAYNEEKNKLRNSLLLNNEVYDPKKIAFLTLQGLTRLRLLANHPKLMDSDYIGDSGKFEQILMRFETLKSENHKVLIFSSFVKHLRLLADYFDKEEWKYAWLSGSTPAANRESEIERFKTDKNVNCFFISLKAGGVGLNLTAADYVFIIDPWWNPASEMQALSRSHRIGQEKNVMVYRFISTDTIEEKIRNLQESKSKLADTFINSTNPLKDMNNEEIRKLLET